MGEPEIELPLPISEMYLSAGIILIFLCTDVCMCVSLRKNIGYSTLSPADQNSPILSSDSNYNPEPQSLCSF